MIDGERIVDGLVAETGLDDFGGESWREGLDHLLAALDDEAELTAVGEAVLTDQIVKPLRNRLEVVAWLRRNPQAAARPIERPVFIVGLPRTGTTLLSYLLDADPANRSLHRWEAFDAVPPPDPATAATDPRMARARHEMAALYEVAPEFAAIHYESAEGPTECVTVLAGDLRSIHYETLATVPSYGAWLDAADLGSAYRWHRDVLAALQASWPGRWVLKSPGHLLALDALVAAYPDATFVATHRDPARVVVSLAHLVAVLSGLSTDADHRPAIGRRWRELVGLMIDRSLDFRDRTGDGAPGSGRWIDLSYEDLTADPLGTVGDLYDRLGWPVTGDTERLLGAYAAANPKDRRGSHRYGPDEFGLDPVELGERFGRYRERFGIRAEPFTA